MSAPLIGYTCSYTPLALLRAAGFIPFRVLPLYEGPELAGQHLHENLCPHVKFVLDRVLARHLPEMAGMVFVNSCDAMRRLADAWQHVRPSDRVARIDLPVENHARAQEYWVGELEHLAAILGEWRGRAITTDELRQAWQEERELVAALAAVAQRLRDGSLVGGRARLQELYNRAMTEPSAAVLPELRTLAASPASTPPLSSGEPVFLFGNVLADPGAFALFAVSGLAVVGDDLCTGGRVFTALDAVGDDLPSYARALLARPPCARTMNAADPNWLAQQLVAAARAAGARGVIGHVVKFCDPYLARLPYIRAAMQAAHLPLLILEGDCTLRSMGQQRTRLEAFVEMLG